jgi:uncharacterized membrane protein YhaH (DUF805 family)
MDIDGIEPGVDFVKALDEQIAQCSAFIAVISPAWMDLKNSDGQRRLDQPNDSVRIEIESALTRDIRVIPVLVDGARMPTAEELPDSLKPLARRNAVMLSHHRFNPEVDELARALQRAGLQAKSVKDTLNTPPSWQDYLFSFKGRISRKSYWLGSLMWLALGFLLFALLSVALNPEELFGTKEDATQLSVLSRIYLIATIPLYWPTYALFLKRIHDFGMGNYVFWPFMILTVIYFGLELTKINVIASGLAILILLGIWTVAGCIKGTQGPNKYGSDPLANIFRKSAT